MIDEMPQGFSSATDVNRRMDVVWRDASGHSRCWYFVGVLVTEGLSCRCLSGSVRWSSWLTEVLVSVMSTINILIRSEPKTSLLQVPQQLFIVEYLFFGCTRHISLFKLVIPDTFSDLSGHTFGHLLS